MSDPWNDQHTPTRLGACDGAQAPTASELAEVARVTRQTASSHLGKLIDAGLVAVSPQGRHRYFRMAAPDVAVMLEGMMGVARLGCTTRVTPGPRDTGLRRARRCYDHLAGELAVEAFDLLVARGSLHASLCQDLCAQGWHGISTGRCAELTSASLHEGAHLWPNAAQVPGWLHLLPNRELKRSLAQPEPAAGL